VNTYDLFELAKEGDRIGKFFEGKPMRTPYDKDLLDRALLNNRGTDESDLLDCWVKFIGSGWLVTPVDWAEYYTMYSNPSCGYGKAMPDFFRLVKYLRQNGGVTYGKLVEISVDRNSFGNLCLQMVLPVVAYAKELGVDPYEAVGIYTVMTHAHPIAQRACAELARLFLEGPQSMLPVLPEKSRTGHADAMHTLGLAWWCAQSDTKEQVIEVALYESGDADSVLALALLLWGWRLQWVG